MLHLSSYQWFALCVAAALLGTSTSACSCTNQQSSEAQQATGGSDIKSETAEVESTSNGLNDIRPEKVAEPKSTTLNRRETLSQRSSSLTADASKEKPPSKDSDRQSPADLAGDPGEAKQSARDLAAAAKQKADSGNFPDAFIDVRNAWSLVSRFPSDAECSQLAAELIIEMQSYAAQSNHRIEGNTEGKMLIVK